MREFIKRDSGLIVAAEGALAVGGVFDIEQYRNGELIDKWSEHNLLTNEGLNYFLDAALHGSTQITAWYIGLFEGNYTPLATVTGATIASAATETTAYAAATRPAYDEAAAASQSTTNAASRASFVFNATKAIYGAFLVSNSTKNGNSGTCLCATRFSSVKNVESTDELLVTYTISAANAS